jgi:hypothetical protein
MAERQAKRVKAKRRIAVGFLGPDIHITGEMVDLSESGVLVHTSQTLAPQTMGRLGMDMGPETFRTIASVRRNVPGVGVAFQFIHMTPHNRDLLHRLLLRLDKHGRS